MDSNSLPPSNLSPAQRKAFNSHLNDLWDDYQDELSDLIIEAKTMVPNSLYLDDDPTGQARLQLEEYARKANLIAQDYYRNVRAAWAEAAGITMPRLQGGAGQLRPRLLADRRRLQQHHARRAKFTDSSTAAAKPA